jgi:hypothetical protein
MFFCWVAAGFIGCGGEVDSGKETAVDPPPSGADTSAGGSHNDAPVQEGLLADCGPGFSPSEATAERPCKFFVGTTCYSTLDEACGCVCPRNQGPVLCVADGNSYLPGTTAYGVWCEPKHG